MKASWIRVVMVAVVRKGPSQDGLEIELTELADGWIGRYRRREKIKDDVLVFSQSK